MENNFIFDFKNLLSKNQPGTARLIGHILITFILTSISEYTFFFSNYTQYDVSECKLPQDPILGYSLSNCFGGDSEIDLSFTKCLNQKYNTGSNYSLEFDVPVSGSNKDHFSTSILAFSIIVYLGIIGILQFCHYFQHQKRIRVQNILAGSMVYIGGNNSKYEIRFGIYFICMAVIYLMMKLLWILYRQEYYSSIECDMVEYQFKVKQGISKSIGIIFQTLFSCLILPAIYVFQSKNLISDVNMKTICDNLSHESLKEFKNLYILDVDRYRLLLSITFNSRYPNDSKLQRFKRENTFSFWETSTSEIIEIILSHKQNYPEDFKPLLILNNNNLIIKTIDNNNQNNNESLNNLKNNLEYNNNNNNNNNHLNNSNNNLNNNHLNNSSNNSLSNSYNSIRNSGIILHTLNRSSNSIDEKLVDTNEF